MSGRALALTLTLLLAAGGSVLRAAQVSVLVRSQPLPLSGVALRLQLPSSLQDVPAEAIRCAAVAMLCQDGYLSPESAVLENTTLLAPDLTKIHIVATTSDCLVSFSAPPRGALNLLSVIGRNLSRPVPPPAPVWTSHFDVWQRSAPDPRQRCRRVLGSLLQGGSNIRERPFPSSGDAEWIAIAGALAARANATVAVVGAHTSDSVAVVAQHLGLGSAASPIPPLVATEQPRSAVAVAQGSPVAWITIALPASGAEDAPALLLAGELLSRPSPMALTGNPIFAPILPGLLQGALFGERVEVSPEILAARPGLVVTAWVPPHLLGPSAEEIVAAVRSLGQAPPSVLRGARTRCLLNLARLAEDPQEVALRLALGWPASATGEDLSFSARTLETVSADELALWTRQATLEQRFVVLLPAPGGPRARPASDEQEWHTYCPLQGG